MIVPTGTVRGSCESFFVPFVLGGLGYSPSRRGKIHLFFLNTPFLFFLGDPYVTWYTFSKLFCAPPPSLLALYFFFKRFRSTLNPYGPDFDFSCFINPMTRWHERHDALTCETWYASLTWAIWLINTHFVIPAFLQEYRWYSLYSWESVGGIWADVLIQGGGISIDWWLLFFT